MTDPKTLTDEQAAWQLINPTGHVVATETNCVKAWARIGGYKPTVEALLGCEEAGWRVERATREQTASTGESESRDHNYSFQQSKAEADAETARRRRAGAAPVEQAGSTPDETTAIEFYRLNPSAALFDFRQRIHAPAPDETLREALAACEELFEKALPKFNWGASFLDGEAIRLLNEVPLQVRRALATPTKPEMQSVHPAAVFGKEET